MPPTLTCTSCNQSFELTPEYLAQYAGQTTTCQCGAPLQIPSADGNPAVQLSYAAPSRASSKTPASAWRDGPFLMIARGVRLPNRCAHCGTPVERKFKLSTLVNIKPGSLSIEGYLFRHFMSDRVRIRYGFCNQHTPWIVSRAAGITLIACAAAIPVLGFLTSQFERHYRELFWACIALIFALMIFIAWFIFAERPIKIESLDFKHVWLAGFDEEYLKHFPPIELQREQDAQHAAKSCARSNNTNKSNPSETGASDALGLR